MKKIILSIVTILGILIPISVLAQEPYVVLSDDNKTLTFYYDDQKSTRGGMNINNSYREGYIKTPYSSTTTAIFDISFANYRPTSTACWFYDCQKLISISGFQNLNTDEVADMHGMFDNCSSLTNLDVSSFNTENVTNMNSMFMGCSNLTTLDLSSFKTDKVTNMEGMFYACSGLTSIDISGFNTENVTKMSHMFLNCSSLTGLDVSSFKTGNVTNMNSMFMGCSNLTTLDLSSFKTDKVTNMGFMFSGCISLTNLDLSSFKTDKVTDMGFMFFGCYSLISLDLSSFNTGNVTSMGYMFCGCRSLTRLDLSSFNTEKVTYMSHMFSQCNNLATIFAGTEWSTVSVDEYYSVFDECTYLIGGNGTKYDADHTDHTYARIDKEGTPGYFTDAGRKSQEPEPYAALSDDNKTVTFFYDDQKSVRGGRDFNNSYVAQSPYGTATTAVFDASFANFKPTSTACWFCKCSSLTTVTGIENLKTDNVTDMSYMFLNCSSLAALDVSGFKTDNVTNMFGMFCDCSSLTSLDVSGFKTDNVTSMHSMFDNCSGLTNLDVSSFNTENVTDMRCMFLDCSSLTNLDVSGFKTDNVTDMTSMFAGCSYISSLDVSGFKTDNVTNMGCMFSSCSSLITIFANENWKTTKVENGTAMFQGCTALVGGSGTKFDPRHTNHTYAHIDGGQANPGYLTDINGNFAHFDGLTLTVEGQHSMSEAIEFIGSQEEISNTIAAIVWNSNVELTKSDLEFISNPNMLIFVKEASMAPMDVKNVVVDGKAKSITLVDSVSGNNNFYAPQEFTAESISYTREFKQATQIDVSRGWESIALPFDVQTYTHEVRGAIAPFENTDSKYHFWLHQMTENGMGMATNIEANKPYIISMPNSDVYPEEYNLAGKVTFAAKNVTIPVTSPVTLTSPDGTVSMVPAFQAVAKSENVYVLNVGEQREEYPEGSVFECNYHDVRPFEVYSILNNVSGSRVSGARFISLSSLFGGNDGSTGIVDLKTTESDLVKVYSLNGVLLKQGKRDEIINSLPKGVYIVNGKKLIVR